MAIEMTNEELTVLKKDLKQGAKILGEAITELHTKSTDILSQYNEAVKAFHIVTSRYQETVESVNRKTGEMRERLAVGVNDPAIKNFDDMLNKNLKFSSQKLFDASKSLSRTGHQVEDTLNAVKL